MDERLTRLWRPLCIGLALACAAPAAASAAPDPLLSSQWALSSNSQIGAEDAWTQSDGAGVIVAVLDSGIQLDHPDLAANIWTNPREIPGNGRDDDGDGIVDDVHGANMFDLSNNVNDDNGHGTHVAGIIAARQDNGIGGSGLAPGAKIMPVKVLDTSMAGTTDTLARGIRYAVDNGARILNVSVNTDTATDALTSAVSYAGAHGAIIVASAGNNGRNLDLLPSYPAALSDPSIMSVAADTVDGTLWSLSNSGPLSVDLAAPGEHIASTATGSGYEVRTGTSAAAPFVSASLALLSAARPDLPMSTLATVIKATTKRSSVLGQLLGTGGRLDVGAAMHKILGASWRSSGASPVAETALRLSARSEIRAKSQATLRWSASDPSDVQTWRVSLDGRVVQKLPVSSMRYSKRISRPGLHRWRVVGFDGSGTKVVAARRSFRVLPRR